MNETLLNTRAAAAYVGLSHKTLERFRSEGTGPAYVKAGPGRRARVRYRKADLDAWLEQQTFTSTTAYAGRTRGAA